MELTKKKTLATGQTKRPSDDPRLKLIPKVRYQKLGARLAGSCGGYLDPETGEPCAKAIDLFKSHPDKESTIENESIQAILSDYLNPQPQREAIEKFSALQPPQELDEFE